MLRAAMLLTFIVFLCWLFSRLYRTKLVRWIRLSDSYTPITTLTLYDGDETIYVYSSNKGQCVSLRFTTGVYSVHSDPITIPTQYATPYEFLKSGELNTLISSHLGVLEMVADPEAEFRVYQHRIKYEPVLDFNADAYHSLNLH